MTIELSIFLVQLDTLTPEGDTELATGLRNQLIKQAVMDYSRDKPDQVTVDVTGDGGKYYPILSNLTSWVEMFSRIESIQYPASAITADETPIYLDQEDWDDNYHDSSLLYLWLPNHAPSSSESFRVVHSAPYVWTVGTSTTSVAQTAHGFSTNDYVYQNSSGTWVAAGSSTENLTATHRVTTVTDSDNIIVTVLTVDVPQIDFFAVVSRAACLVCQAISERYSRSSDSTIAADSVNHTTKAGEFSRRAKEFCKLYNAHLGISTDSGGESQTGHAEFVDLDTAPGFAPGRQFLFHGRHTR